MRFIWPLMLIFLALIPLAVALYLRLQERRRQTIARYGSLGFVQNTAGQQLGRRRHLPPARELVQRGGERTAREHRVGAHEPVHRDRHALR